MRAMEITFAFGVTERKSFVRFDDLIAATLDTAAGHHPVECEPVIEAGIGKRGEIRHGDRSFVGIKLDTHGKRFAALRFDNESCDGVFIHILVLLFFTAESRRGE